MIRLPPHLAELLELDREVDQVRLAQVIAERAGWRRPTQPETVAILVAITLDFASDPPTDDAHYVGVLNGFHADELDADRWLEHVIAARDLGLLDRAWDGPPITLSKLVDKPGVSISWLFTAVWEAALGDWLDDLHNEYGVRGWYEP